MSFNGKMRITWVIALLPVFLISIFFAVKQAGVNEYIGMITGGDLLTVPYAVLMWFLCMFATCKNLQNHQEFYLYTVILAIVTTAVYAVLRTADITYAQVGESNVYQASSTVSVRFAITATVLLYILLLVCNIEFVRYKQLFED